MSSGPFTLLGFTHWNACWTSSSLVWSLWKSSSAADTHLKHGSAYFFYEKSWQLKWLKNWFSSLAPSAVFTEESFCVLLFTYLLINHLPIQTLLILLYVKWLSTFFLYCSFSFWISSFSSFCTDLYSFLSFFWKASFFLFMILLILLVIQGLLFGNIFTVFCGTACTTQSSTCPHTDSVNSLISLAESTNTSQSVQSRDPRRFSTASADHSLSHVNKNWFTLHKRPVFRDTLN